MASEIFSNLIAKGLKDRSIPTNKKKARDWYRNAASGVRHVNNNKLLLDSKENLKSRPEVGKMYLFQYDPKHKDILPYYDTYPLVFPIGPAKGGFYGINLHYIPPVLRAKLLDQLYEYISDDRYDANTKLKISYKILKSTEKLKPFRPCFKHYLSQHVQSKFLWVDPNLWDMVVMLPLARWEKRTGNRVYADSLRMIGD